MNRYERLNEERKIIDTRKRVAAYCRVSTDNEDQANSFESQQRYFKQYIERNPDWELYEIFADEGISGTSTKKRKEFNRMIACAKNGDFDLIITKEISRFARNTLDSIYYTRDLKKHGVGVIFMNDNINTLDGDAELRLAIMSSIAQEESRKTSERVKWGQKRQMEQGVVFGRSMLGYDVKDGKMTINEEGAKIVRLIFHKFVNEGKGTHVIARELREEGIEPMRVKEWQNTVILRVIRNEKYCGDLVQKKTYTPDFLSHEKKYNRGQEEFVIIKDHHEPIVSRELFEEANRILDERSLSQEGKAKHSNRYPFSGKIKCGHCGASYVARYKTRKDGSKYKAWRCQEAAKHGSPHTDKAGNQIGCTGASIRNEDATHIMFLVTKELKLRQTKITKNLTSIIESIIAMDTTGTDIEKLKTQIATIEDKRTKLIDIYMSGDISKDEFSAARSKCDAEIAELQSVIDSIDKQQAMIRQQQELVQEIRDAINEIVSGVEYDDEFYKHILDKMVVNDKDNIDVYLNLLPMKWSYTVAKASKKALAPERNISGASVPTEEPTPTPAPTEESTPTPAPNPNPNPATPTPTPVAPVVPATVATPTPKPTATPSTTPSDNGGKGDGNNDGEIGETINDNETPLANGEDIADNATPLAGLGTGAWALINLILTIVTTLLSILLLIGYIGKKKKALEDEDGNVVLDENGKEVMEYEKNKKGLWRLISIIPALIAIIVFIFTEDMTLPMIFVDKWTILHVVIALVQVVVMVLCKKRKDENDEDENAANA